MIKKMTKQEAEKNLINVFAQYPLDSLEKLEVLLIDDSINTTDLDLSLVSVFPVLWINIHIDNTAQQLTADYMKYSDIMSDGHIESMIDFIIDMANIPKITDNWRTRQVTISLYLDPEEYKENFSK